MTLKLFGYYFTMRISFPWGKKKKRGISNNENKININIGQIIIFNTSMGPEFHNRCIPVIKSTVFLA